ncbi:MAG: hypothetical protein J2P48_17610 [Alphaproteobacteria bacterium]|nr:hypothetical protein [Alphaproteobacteria bacterium]
MTARYVIWKVGYHYEIFDIQTGETLKRQFSTQRAAANYIDEQLEGKEPK